ncbi:MAG: DUF4864 domain-containing protein [Micavibrio sp.]
MKSNDSHPYSLALVLLGMALTSFLITGRADTADANEKYGPYPVSAKVVSTPADDDIHDLIKIQLEALRNRDGDVAYALTASSLHKKYDNSQAFMNDMRFSYRPLYNNMSYKFLDQTPMESGGLIQRIQVDHTHGDPAIVIYRLERNPEGEWRIESFSLLEQDNGTDI